MRKFIKHLPTIIAGIIFIVLSICLIIKQGAGTLSGFGWNSISALCPLGALETILASKTIIPRALISLIVMLVIFLVAGRVFCGYICPIPLLKKAKKALRNRKKLKNETSKTQAELKEIAQYEIEKAKKKDCDTTHACAHNCAGCAPSKKVQRNFDGRHISLIAALASTAIFGFPVFCLICPIGLSFASVLVLWRLFAAGDVTISVIVIPAVLILELVLLKKWCIHSCPLSGLMTLVSRFSKTFKPHINNELCIETTTNKPCSQCALVCPEHINLRHISYGEKNLNDCTRCLACVAACPAQAIKISATPKKNNEIEKQTRRKEVS